MTSSPDSEGPILLHLLTAPEWEVVKNEAEYRPPSLAEEGFIHCSTIDQIAGPANRFYRGQTDCLLLVLDPARLNAPVVFEDTYGHGAEFPHLYGPLNLDAVVEVVRYPCHDDGTFTRPADLDRV